jgi:hypothetical protein
VKYDVMPSKDSVKLGSVSDVGFFNGETRVVGMLFEVL